jgi:hypothetical protein
MAKPGAARGWSGFAPGSLRRFQRGGFFLARVCT